MYFKNLFSLNKGVAKAAFKALMLKVLMYLSIIAVLIVLLAKTISYASARYACHTQWVESGINYKYTLRGGCLLKVKDGWIPANNYRIGS